MENTLSIIHLAINNAIIKSQIYSQLKNSCIYLHVISTSQSFKARELTLSSVKQVLSRALMVMGRVVIRVKLVVLTAVGPPGLGAK